MQQHQQRQRTRHAAMPDGDPSDAATGGEGDSLLQQAAQYAEVARQARDACAQGEKAEEELRRRRNRSGQ